MPRRITVTFNDGSQHIYENAPDDVTPQQVVDRATKEFRKPVKALDGGRGVIERTARAVGGIASGIYDAADKAMQPLRDAVGYDAAAQNRKTDEAASRKRAAIQTDIATQDGLLDAAGDFFLRGEMSAAAGIERTASGLALNAAERQRYVDRARASEQVARTPIAGETTWENATSNLTRMPGFILEKGIESLPYMATAAAGPFGFLANAASTTGQVAQSRAESDNRQDASASDVAIAAPFGAVSTALDSLSLGALTKGFGGGIASGIAKGALLEGGTEAIQSGIEYTGGAVGTQRGFDVSELGSQMLQGGVVGFGVGAGFSGIHEGGKKVVRVIGDKVRLRPIAPGVRATAATTAAVPTEDDIASPIPTDLIQQGKASVADAEAKASADSILRAAGMPATGTRVNVRMPDGTTHTGTMADAFMTDGGDMGIAAGLAVNLDDGTIFTEHFDTLHDTGVTVTPVDAGVGAPELPELYHGGRKGMSVDDIQIIREPGATKQGKKGRTYGGFYATSKIDEAQGYADMAEGSTVYRVQLAPGSKVETKEGDVTRLSASTIEEYRNRGVDVVIGKDPRGRTEYVVINKDAITGLVDTNSAGTQDPAAAANAAFDDVVNSAAQAGGFAAPGSGLLNPPALPAPADQAEQPKGMRGTPVKDAKAAIEAVYPGVRVTSWTRGADSVGSPTSWHKRSRAAVDVAPIKGMTFDEFIGGLKAKGYSIIEAIDEVKNPSKWATGPHWHVVLGEGGSQQAGAGPRATSAPVGGESVQDDMFGGVSLTESQIAARDNIGRVLDEAVQEDDTFELRKAARELEAARVDFEATGRQGKFSDYVDPMSDIPMSLRQSIDANPNLLPLVLQRAGIEDAAANVAAPTDAQKEAGNYRKGHVRLHGLDITIETPRGAERSGTDPNGNAWSVSMPDHYGYVKRTEGADGEQVDVYIGPNPESTRVYLIDQNDADTGQFDEHKAMLGYRSVVDATEAYAAAFDDGRGPERMGNVVEMSTAEFKEWLKQPQTAPAGETMPQGTTGTGAAAPAATTSLTDGMAAVDNGDTVGFEAPDGRLEITRTGRDAYTVDRGSTEQTFSREQINQIAEREGWSVSARTRAEAQAEQRAEGRKRFAAKDGAQPSSNPEQLPAAQEDAQDEGPLSTEEMPGAGARNKLVLRTHKVDGGYRVDADYEIGGFSGGTDTQTAETPEAARAKIVERLGRQLDPSGFGSSANDQQRSAATKMLKWLRRGEQQDTSGPQDGGVAAPVEAPEAGGPEATAASSAGSAAGAATPSRARVEDTGTGKSVVIIGASEAELAAVAAAIPNAKPLPPRKSDGGVVYSKKYEDKIREVLADEVPSGRTIGDPVAIGRRAFETGEPRRPPDTFPDKKLWLKGWDLANLSAPTPTTRGEDAAAAPKTGEPRLTRDQIADRLAEALGQTRGDMHNGIADAIHEKDFWLLNGRLQPHNKKSRKVFTEATGVVLPNTKAGTEQALRDWAGISQAEIDRVRNESAVRRAGERSEQERQAYRRLAEGVRVSYQGETIGGAQFVDDRIAEGFNRVVNISRGAVPKYALANAENQGFPVQGAIAQYAKIVARDETRRPTENVEEPYVPLSEEEAAAQEGMTVDEYREAAAAVEELFQPPVPADGRIGTNADGLPLYEDENGVRSFVRNGIRLTESVQMRPVRGGGMEMSVDKAARNGDYLTEQERAAKAVGTAPEHATVGVDDRELSQIVAEFDAAQKGSTPKPSKFAGNKVFTEDKVAAARARLKDKLNRLNAGIDPELLMDGIVLAGAHIEAGIRKFADLARTLADDLGTDLATLKPYLRAWYNGARDMLEDAGEDVSDMDGPGAVKAALTMIEDMATPPAESAKEAVENDDAGAAVYPDGAGSLEGAPSGDVPRPGSERDSERAGTGSQQGSRAPDRNADGRRDAKARGGRNGSARRDPPATGAGSPVNESEPATKTAGEIALTDPNETIEKASPANVPAKDFVITDDLRLGQGTELVKFEDNVAAIETLKKIESENRRASPAEQRVLARYVGWGGLKNAFRVAGSGAGEGVAKGWEKRVAQVEELLTPAELKAARNSTTAAHYTSQTVVEAMWAAAERLGFTGGAVLEPSVGTGNFLGLMPKGLRGQTKVFAVEYDSLTARMAQKLYPNAAIIHSGFQALPMPKNQFALAIGNPPFGRESLHFPHNSAVNDKSIHNQFFLASLDSVAPGGLMAMVVSHNLMDALDASSRYAMAAKAEFLGGIRLPDTAFKENARTEVVTDMLFFRKRTESDASDAEFAVAAAQGRRLPDGKQPDGYKLNRMVAEIDSWTKSSTIPDPAGSGEKINANAYFLNNPQMVIGEINATGTMNQRADLNVTLADPAQFKPLLDKAVARLPQGRAASDLTERTVRHFEIMANAMRLEAQRAEVGSVQIDVDKNLKMVIDLDGGDLGKSLKREIVLTENTPFNEEYSLGVDGKWQRTIDKLGADGKPMKVVTDGRITNRNQKETITFERETDIPAKDRWGKDRIAALRDMLAIRDAMKRQLALESQGATDGMIAVGRKALNAAYDAFVSKHGTLHTPKNAKIASTMPDGGLILATEQMTGKGKAAKVVKSDIMSRRVAMPPQLAETADSAEDAIAISLSENGRIDLARVAKLLGTDEDGAAKALSEGENPAAFYDPENQRWEPRDLYLSGMVRRKLNIAREQGLQANVAALEAVLPADWTMEQITPILGSPWIPGKVYADFLRYLGYTKASVHYSALTNTFSVSTEGGPGIQWATSERAHTVEAIVSKMLNSQGLKVVRLDENKKQYVDEEGTAESEAKGAEIYNEFLSWAFADEARAQDLVTLFNEKFNTRLIRQRDGSHLKLYGKVPDTVIKMRRHQMNAIWRGITDRAVLYDHVVGAGKTFTAIARVMERRRMGLSQKPLIVVPNHLVEQWAKDVKALYPGANVLAAGKADFERKNRRRLFARIGSSDFDMAIIGHSSFGFIDIDPATEERFLDEELIAAHKAVKEAEEAAAEEGIGGRRKPLGVADAERLVKKIEERLAKLRTSKRDRLLTFEEMGIDDLTIDEAHEFKNLAYSSRLQNVAGMGNKTGSQKAMDLHLKVRSLAERPGSSIAFLTGTPISNSVAEMYLVLRNLAPTEMKEMGIDNFDAWRSMFVAVGTKWEVSITGGVKEVNRLGREWNNMRTLMDLYYSVSDAVSIEDIKQAFAEDNPGKKFPVPDVASARKGKGDRELVVIEPDDVTAQMLNEIVDDYRGLKGITDIMERNIARLKLMDRARKVSLDPRAVDPNNAAPTNGGKIVEVAKRTAAIYRKWQDDKGTQIIFLDRSVPKAKGDEKIVEAYDDLQARLAQAVRDGDDNAEARILDDLEKYDPNEIEALRVAVNGGWNAYDELKRHLVAMGIPAEEIRFVQEANTDQQKRELFDLVKSGAVRVLIGSTPRMGAGTNVQDRLVALHHVDVTWKPSDIEQREGRIVRQGNLLLEKYGDDFEVEVLAYAVERTADANMWSLNADKLKAINGIRKYDGSFNMEFEDAESTSMAEMAALATGDPLMVERVTLDSAIKKLEVQQRSFNNRQNALRSKVAQHKRTVAAAPGRIAMLEGFADEVEQALAGVAEREAGRSISIEGKVYKDRDEAEAAAQAAIAEIRGEDTKARFSIEVAGKKVTTQDDVANAIRAAFGTPGFEATFGGKTFILMSDAAKEIAMRLVGAHQSESFTLDGITINGLPFELDVAKSRWGKSQNVVTLSAMDRNRKTVSSYESISEGVSVNLIRSLLQKANDGLAPWSFRGAAKTEQRYADAAEKELPGLEVEAEKPWAQEDELANKRDRQKELVAILAEKEKGSVKEDVDPIEGVAEDGGPAYDGVDDDPTDPDGPKSGSRNDQLDRRPESGRADRRDGLPVVRGMGIAARFDQHGATALVGEFVSHSSELAALAQIYRDPRHETLRVFFTKGAQVVHATAVTTRSASRSPLLPGNLGQDAFVAWAQETMATTGANGFYLMHNHPSGDPAPSPEDQELTAQIARKVSGFKGHVIINSNRYAVLDSLGREKLYELSSAPDKLLTPSTPHPLVGQHITGPARLALVSKAAQLAQGDYVTIVIANPKNIVRAVIDVPRSELTRPDIILLGALRRYLRMAGGDRAYLVGTMADLALPAVRSAMRNGVLAGTVNENELASKSPADTPDFLLGGPARAVAETRDPIDDSPAFENEETERRFQEAKAGLATTQTLRERIAEGWEKAWHGITRHWIALPNEPRYASLQEKLRAIEAAPQSARERTIRMLDDMVKDFTDDDLDLFTRKVILDDLAWDAANQRELPFGFTQETLRAEKAKIDQLVKDQPDQRVYKAAMKRKLVNRKIAQELVDAGVLEAEQIKNPAYYRHQVLEYARAQAQYARTPGKKLRTPKWAKRMGSSLDINANLLEAEFDWLNKAFIDIPVAQTIEWIKKSEHNILDRLKKQAKDSNDEGVQRELNKARELLEQNESGPEVEEAMALIEREKGFRQSIAMGFEYVRTALENDEIDVPPRFRKAADAIEGGKGSTSEPPFAFLSWLLDSNEPGAMGAAMIMKAISQRRVWTKNLLGRDYIDPQNADELVKRLAPEGYRTWQPDEGKLLFTVKTLPEHVIDGMIEKLETMDGIDQTAFRAALEGARSALAMGGDRYTMILPQEVADTLSQLRRDEIEGLFDHFIKEPVRLWKRWVLINPRRFFKYNLNNTSGDLDAVIAGNPRSLRKIGAAGRELAEVMRGKAKASDRYNEAVARGVFDSGLSVQEIPDIHKLEPFERFAKKPGAINRITVMPLRKAWAALQGATQWRENVMRYAAYLDYVERIEAGESQKSIGYGASRPDMVDAVVDPKDRAALLARDLLGDYGAISHYGGWLRQTVIPFWSWTEINTKRYWRLTANAYSEGIGKGVATGGALAIAQGARTTAWLALRMAMLYGLFSLWNSLFFPDEEDELGEAQRAQMHVILGRNAEGEIISMRAQGALSDALSWFGLENVGKAARDYELGRGSLVDVLTAAPKAAINKVATSLSPVITVPVEAATGKKLWPDVFNTRANRDPWRNLFQTVSLENEYDMAQGLPTRGYGRSWQEAVIYRRDPGEIAYNEGRGIAYDWLQREKGQSFEGGFSTPRGNAMRDYRTALRYGDREAAAKALDEMVKLGVDAGDFSAMVKRAAPLGPIPKKDQAAFIAQLTEDERQTMVRAQEWYNATFLGR